MAIARGAGATVVGIGVIDWLLGDATGPALRGLLGGNLAVQALSSASVLHLILSLLLLLALRTAR